MKIREIEAFQVSWASDDKPQQRSAFVRIHGDDGLSGIGEASPMQGGIASLGIIARDVAPLLIGQDPLDHAVLLDRALHSLVKLGPEGALSGALAALDIALWDLKGKLFNQPIYKLIVIELVEIELKVRLVNPVIDKGAFVVRQRRLPTRHVDDHAVGSRARVRQKFFATRLASKGSPEQPVDHEACPLKLDREKESRAGVYAFAFYAGGVCAAAIRQVSDPEPEALIVRIAPEEIRVVLRDKDRRVIHRRQRGDPADVE